MSIISLSFLVLSSIQIVNCAYQEEPYHTLTVPFGTENGGQTTEQVFMEFHCHTVLYDRNMAMKITLNSSEEVFMAMDKCGMRIFETTEDTDNATFILGKEWVETMLTGIDKTCDVINEYAANFTFDCKGPCNGTITFSLLEINPDDLKANYEKSNSATEAIPFETLAEEVPAIANAEMGVLIEAVFLNPSLRLEFDIEYSTNYIMTLRKCNLEFLKLTGDGNPKKHVLTWEEIKLIRMVKLTECPENRQDTVKLAMTSVHPGYGTVTFSMTRNKVNLLHHPANDYTSMILARGVPKHNSTRKAVPKTKMSNTVGILLVPLVIFIVSYFTN
ncbi:hypothetical protein CRE_05991 [Caenorhabditis remanei]|uniref:Uncharacterized protein n=1 Tax=Caenorhabditis remanei TaxID=31234 RepID=E3MZG1_CAERE|nr:hypothetical protein CRE_05991 [Caenorhabditis remanei]